jgi:SAM-dependent methyltransferase
VQELGRPDPALLQALRRELRPYRNPLLAWPYRHVPWIAHRAKQAAKALARRSVPAPVLRFAKAKLRGRPSVPPPGWVRLGSLRRLAPLSRSYGYDRGLPIDRHYIEAFLAAHACDLRGRALEVGDDSYTRRFGGSRVERRDVLHVVPGAPGATVIANLAAADHVPSDAFDCIVLTQTLQLIYELPAAVATLHRILRPGGVVLATVPGISQISDEQWRDTWFWAFTPHSARRLFADAFGPENVEVQAHGNVLAATAFLNGMSAGELRAEELAHHDPSYPLLVTVRAVKAASE